MLFIYNIIIKYKITCISKMILGMRRIQQHLETNTATIEVHLDDCDDVYNIQINVTVQENFSTIF